MFTLPYFVYILYLSWKHTFTPQTFDIILLFCFLNNPALTIYAEIKCKTDKKQKNLTWIWTLCRPQEACHTGSCNASLDCFSSPPSCIFSAPAGRPVTYDWTPPLLSQTVCCWQPWICDMYIRVLWQLWPNFSGQSKKSRVQDWQKPFVLVHTYAWASLKK